MTVMAIMMEWMIRRIGTNPCRTRALRWVQPMDIGAPVSAYFFLSDIAQDEFTGKEQKKDEMSLLWTQIHGRNL
jgi:hypothetical protein